MPSDELARAITLHRQLAAARLVRRDELDAEIAAATDEAQAGALRAERAGVEAEYRDALKEIAELQRLARTAPIAGAALPAADDPLTPSPEQAALDNVRAHIRSLDAQVRVNDELRGTATEKPEPEPPAPSGPKKRTM